MSLTFLFMLTGCGHSEVEKTPQRDSRIKSKGVFYLLGIYEIIEIDGVEYVSSYKGGLCPLVKQNSDKTVFKENVGSIEYNTIDLP